MRGLVLCEIAGTGPIGTFMDTLMDLQDSLVDCGVNNYVYYSWNPWDRLVSSYVFARASEFYGL